MSFSSIRKVILASNNKVSKFFSENPLNNKNKKLAQNAFKTLIYGSFGSLMKFIIDIIIIKILSVYDYAQFALVLGAVVIITNFVSGGARSVIERYFPKFVNIGDHKNALLLLLKVVLLMLMLYLFVFLVIFFYPSKSLGFFFEDITGVSWDIAIVLALILFTSCMYLLSVTFRAAENTKMFNFVNEVYPNIFALIGLIYLISLNDVSLMNVLYVYLGGIMFSVFLGCLIFYSYIRKSINTLEFSSNKEKEVSKNIKVFAAYSTLLIVVWILRDRLAIFLLHDYISIESVAYFSVSLKLLFIGLLIKSAINSSFISKMAIEEKTDTFLETYKLLAKWTVVCSYPLIIFLAIFSEYIMNFLFGGEYKENSEFVMIMLAYLSLTLIIGPTSLVTQMKGKQNVEIVIISLSLTTLLLFSEFIATFFGVLGVVGFFYLVIIISDFFLGIYLYREFKLLPLNKSNLKIFIILLTIILGLLLLLLNINFSFVNSIFLLILFESVVIYIIYFGLIRPNNPLKD